MALTQLSPSTVLAEKIGKANALGLRIKAAKSDKTAMVREILASSDDEKMVKIRAEIEKMKERIAKAEELAKEHALTLVPGVDENFDVEEATQEFLRLRRECVAARSALETLIDPATLAAELESLGVAELVNLRGTGNRKGSNTGVKRPRYGAA